MGGLFFKSKLIGGNKIGFIDHVFTDPSFQGRGIAKRLCVECFNILWEEGCTALFTIVQDDNVGSWKLFTNNGFVLTGLPQMAKLLGLGSALKTKLYSSFGFTPGYDGYLALPENAKTPLYEKPANTLLQTIMFMLANLLFAVPLAIAGINIPAILAAVAILFFGSILAGFAGTLFSFGRKWRFRFTPGGMLISALTALANLMPGFAFFWPVNGGWYPSEYENTPRFRRDMAITSVTAWVFTIGMYLLGLLWPQRPLLLIGIRDIAALLLFIRLIPISPMTSYGARRVLQWNKAVYVVMLGAAVFAVFVLPRVLV